MAIEVCSEISSPRISFSRDLDKTDSVSIEEDHDHQQRLDSSLLDSNSEFNFCIGNNNSFFQEISPADELFSNGKILAVQMKKQIVSTTKKQTHQQNHKSPTIPSSSQNSAEKKIIRLKEFLSMSLDSDDQDQKPSSKSFWQFKRSSSLNCDSTRSKSLIKSLQFLSRSNSTGSAPNPKPEAISKESQKQNLQRQPSVSRKPSSSTGTYYFYSSSNNNYSTLKPPLKKCGSYNGNGGVRISPVLNIAPPCISNATVSGLFGLGSIFCNGKIRKKKR